MSIMNEKPVGRRSFIKGAAFGLGAVAFGGPLLTACGTPVAGPSAGSSLTPLPAFIAQTVAQADFKTPTQGAQDAYLRFPTEKVITVKDAVGTGKPVTALSITYSQPPAALDQNTYWQFLNKTLNIDYKPILATPGDFPAKFASTMAGGDLPDLTAIPVFLGIPRIPEMFNTLFQDLSEFLSGDAVKAYPNLANIPTEAWKYCRVGGKIVGVPTPRPTTGPYILVRKDLFENLGVGYSPKNAADFEAMCKAVTDRTANRYALSAFSSDFGTSWHTRTLAGFFGAPNNWKLDDASGKLTRDIETSEFKDTIAFIKKLWDGGYWHPDSPGQTAANQTNLFVSGNVVTGSGTWSDLAAKNPKIDIDVINPFGANGGNGTTLSNRPLFSVTALKKTTDKDRVRELLRVLNYLAAPFGSQEYFNNTFGVEGTDYTVVDGVPTLTKTGSAEQGISITRLANGPQVLFSAKPVDAAIKGQFDYQVLSDSVAVKDPTHPYWPNTVTQMTSLEKGITSGITDIVTGRQPLSSLDDIAKTWRTGGGDELRKLYQDSIAADKK